jgi:hypothetical protein
LPIRFKPNADDWDEDSTAYIVEEAILLWASEKFDLDTAVPATTKRNYDEVIPVIDKYFKVRYRTDGEVPPAIPKTFSKESIENDIDMDAYYKMLVGKNNEKVINYGLINELTLKKEQFIEKLEKVELNLEAMRKKVPPFDLMGSTELWGKVKEQNKLKKNIEKQLEETNKKLDIENQGADDSEGNKNVILNYYTEDELKNILGKIPNSQTNDIIRGYFEEDPSIALNICRIADITPSSFTLEFQVKKADENNFKNLKILIPNHDDIIIWNCQCDIDKKTGMVKETKSVLIDNLYPNSEYFFKVIVSSNNEAETLISMRVITLDEETNLAPSVEKINKRRGNPLLGYKW